jgi:hypothetical protein
MELSQMSKSFNKKIFKSKNVIGDIEGVIVDTYFCTSRAVLYSISSSRNRSINSGKIPPCLAAVLWTGKLARGILVHARNVLQVLGIRHSLETGLEKPRVF